MGLARLIVAGPSVNVVVTTVLRRSFAALSSFGHGVRLRGTVSPTCCPRYSACIPRFMNSVYVSWSARHRPWPIYLGYSVNLVLITLPTGGGGPCPRRLSPHQAVWVPPAARSTASALPTPATYHTAAGMLAAMAIGGRSPDSLSIENWATLMNAIRERHRSQAGLLHQIEQAVHRGDAPQALHDRLCQMGRPADAVTALNYGVVYAAFSRRSLRTRRTS